jgi:hypothetical protein
MARVNALAAVIAAVAGVVFVVAFEVAIIYWQDQRRSRSQSKKKRLRAIMWRWIRIAGATCIISLLAWAVYYLKQPSEKQYVLKGQPSIDLTAGEPVIFTIEIENGPGDVTVGFHNVTCKFRGRSNEKILSYDPDRPDPRWSPVRKLMPHQKIPVQWQFNRLALTPEQIADLTNSKMPDGQLFIFAKAEWTEESGASHTLPFCYQYTQRFPNNLASCADDIKFK